MHDFSLSTIHEVALHFVGSKSREQEIKISESLLNIDDELTGILPQLFFNPFKSEALYNFNIKDGREDNIVCNTADKLFNDDCTLYEASTIIAEQLFNASEQPNIKAGELFVAFIDNCIVNNLQTNALGIFKIESKETILQIQDEKGNLKASPIQGISTSKLDKGCIIFNLENQKGYLALIVDTKKEAGNEALYWKDEFLNLIEHNDDFSNTNNFLKAYKNFCDDSVIEEDLDKGAHAKLINKAVDFFAENDTFETKRFEDEVLEKQSLINSFKEYRHEFAEDNNIEVVDEFGISQKAYKDNKKFLKSVLKLDRNFHVYVHGDHEKIEKGFDESKGLKYYKLYFDKES